MKVIYSDQNFISENELVATVGFFDGLHAGHKFLLQELLQTARTENRLSAVFTFVTHPRKVLNSEFQPLLLTSTSEKLDMLERTGVDICVLLNFDTRMAALPAAEFITDLLFNQFNVRTLIVGHDHRFGRDRVQGFDDYKNIGAKIGMNVLQAKKFVMPGNSNVSSSEIRKLLAEGEIEKANTLLGYCYSFTGNVVEGHKNGRTLGYPTANMELPDDGKIVPGIGVYAVWVYFNNQKFGGMLNIGKRPTLQNGEGISIEVNIFDFDKVIYGKRLTVLMYCKVRDEKKFESLDELKLQLSSDKIFIQQLLEKNEYNRK